MKKILIALLGSVFATSAIAGTSLSNKDSQNYRILLNSSASCFSGTRTSIGSNSVRPVVDGWACLREQKPAVKLERGKSYIIKNGKIIPK